MRLKLSETQVAAAVMEYLAGQGWDCFPEVVLPWGRADIVAVRPMPFSNGRCVHIVETKTSWSLSLIEQALQRQEFAHYVSIAAPQTKKKHHSPALRMICKDYGLGIMTVSGADPIVDEYRVEPARLCRGLRAAKRMNWGPWRTLSMLHEDQKRFVPGSATGSGYSTKFSRTMDRCERFIAKHPGCTVAELVAGVDSHYASNSGFKQGILSWLHKRPHIHAIKSGRAIQFYYAGPKQ